MGTKAALALVVLAALVPATTAPSVEGMDLSRLIAPVASCADQNDLRAPVAIQEKAMKCMTNYARQRADRARLGDSQLLDRSAEDKSGDIVRCDSFSHFACGRDFTYWMHRVGYIPTRCWRVGENIAWGAGDSSTVRAIFRAWVHSPGHLANILGTFDQLGVGLRVGTLDGRGGVHVWTQHFGEHC